MGFDQDVGGSETDDGVLEVEGATVVPGIVAHHLPDGYSVAGIELGGAGQEASTGVPFLIGEHLRISQPGMVIDGRMDVVETNPTVHAVPDSMVAACLSSPAPATTVRDPAQLLHVDVDQVARSFTFITTCASARGPDLNPCDGVQIEQLRQASPGNNPRRSRGADPEPNRKLRWSQTFTGPRLKQQLSDRGRSVRGRPCGSG